MINVKHREDHNVHGDKRQKEQNVGRRWLFHADAKITIHRDDRQQNQLDRRQEQFGYGIRRFGGRVVLFHEGHCPAGGEDQHVPTPGGGKGGLF